MGKFLINHKTIYEYTDVINESAFKIVIYPISQKHVEITNHQIIVTTDPIIEIHTDYHGNKVGTFSVVEPHSYMVIDSTIQVNTSEITMPNLQIPATSQWEKLSNLSQSFQFYDYLMVQEFKGINELKNEIASWKKEGIGIYEYLQMANQYVNKMLTYQKGITHVETSLDEIWRLKAGVCQDFSHLLLEVLRIAGIPARYASGYICPVNHDLIGEGATHAWVEGYIPDYGWLGIDPTNDCLASDKHVKIAHGRNYVDISPVKGVYRGNAENKLSVNVTIKYDDFDFSDFQPLQYEPKVRKKKNLYMENMEAIQQQQ